MNNILRVEYRNGGLLVLPALVAGIMISGPAFGQAGSNRNEMTASTAQTSGDFLTHSGKRTVWQSTVAAAAVSTKAASAADLAEREHIALRPGGKRMVCASAIRAENALLTARTSGDASLSARRSRSVLRGKAYVSELSIDRREVTSLADAK